MQAAPRVSTRLFLCLGLMSLGAWGCTRDQPRTSAQATTPAPTAPAAVATAPTPPPGDDSIAGTVVETMDSGGYTYAKIDRGGSQVWVAGPATKLAVGTKVGAMTGTLMTGFRSDTLDRTFDQIYFVGSFPGASAAAVAEPQAPAATATGSATEMIEKIEPAAGGTTVAGVYAGKATLAGKPVVVRGKVVKLNTGIMGRNWLHLRDGTGGAGTNDLLVTTDATVNVGDVVVARGTLATDKDFGGGYKYDVVVESATIATK